MNIRNSLAQMLFRDTIRSQVRAALAAETDATFSLGARQFNTPERDRYDYDRETLQQQALLAWRSNPIARRIVELTSQYVVGGGISLSSCETGAHAFLQQWWNHPLNQCPVRVVEWCDELTRSGELFFLISTDAGGMSYIRAVPSGRSPGSSMPPTICSRRPLSSKKYPAGWGRISAGLPRSRLRMNPAPMGASRL